MKKELVKILPADYPTLRDAIIGSLRANGAMTFDQLRKSLPYFKAEYIRMQLMRKTVRREMPWVRRGGLIELREDNDG